MTTPLLPTTHPDGLSFELLGEVRGWRDGIELPLGAPRQRALLAALLLRAGSPVGRDHLIDGIWGDATVADGPNLVQAYVSKLRRLFEPDRAPRTAGGVLTRVGASYRLSIGPQQYDLGRFEQSVAEARALRSAGRTDAAERTLAAALDSWTGPALTGVSGPLLDVERARLAELRLAVVEEHAELALRLGGHAWLVPHLFVLTTEHPYRERLWALLMVALYRGSRQADALAAYQRARHTLMENLGLVPGPELRGIEEAILAGRPDPLAPALPAQALPSPARPAPVDTVDAADAADALTAERPDEAASGRDGAPAYRAEPRPGRPHLALVGTTPAAVPAPRAAARGPWADGPTRLAR